MPHVNVSYKKKNIFHENIFTKNGSSNKSNPSQNVGESSSSPSQQTTPHNSYQGRPNKSATLD